MSLSHCVGNFVIWFLSQFREKELADRVVLHLYLRVLEIISTLISQSALLILFCLTQRNKSKEKLKEDFLVGLIKSLCPVVLWVGRFKFDVWTELSYTWLRLFHKARAECLYWILNHMSETVSYRSGRWSSPVLKGNLIWNCIILSVWDHSFSGIKRVSLQTCRICIGSV